MALIEQRALITRRQVLGAGIVPPWPDAPQQADVRAVDRTLPSIGPGDLPYEEFAALKRKYGARLGTVGAGHGWQPRSGTGTRRGSRSVPP